MLFTSMNASRADASSHHQQIIDAFLNDGTTRRQLVFAIHSGFSFFTDFASAEFDSLPLCAHAVLFEAISHVALNPKFDLPRKTYEFIGREELSYHDPSLFDKNFHPGLISLRSLELIRGYGKDYHNDKTRLVESEVNHRCDERLQRLVGVLRSF
jgi:hypothetical protein